MIPIVNQYLELMDSQQETAFVALKGITDSQLWQRPAPKEWSIGEILNHITYYPPLFLPRCNGYGN